MKQHTATQQGPLQVENCMLVWKLSICTYIHFL